MLFWGPDDGSQRGLTGKIGRFRPQVAGELIEFGLLPPCADSRVDVDDGTTINRGCCVFVFLHNEPFILCLDWMRDPVLSSPRGKPRFSVWPDDIFKRSFNCGKHRIKQRHFAP